MTYKPYLALSIVGTVAVSSCIWDTNPFGNPDGKIRVACIGDSNTAPVFGNWCAALTQKYKATKSEKPEDNEPEDINLLFSTWARVGSTALDTRSNDTPGGPLEDAPAQLDRALAGKVEPATLGGLTCKTPGTWPAEPWEECDFWNPWDKKAPGKADVVVLAAGSNDLNHAANEPGPTAQQVFDGLLRLKATAEAAHAQVFIATVPPQWAPVLGADGKTFSCPRKPYVQDQIDKLNALLTNPAKLNQDRVVDLHTGFTCPLHYVRYEPDPKIPGDKPKMDGIHMSGQGNDLRIKRGDDILKREFAKLGK